MKLLTAFLLLVITIIPCRAEGDSNVTELMGIDPSLVGLWMLVAHKMPDKEVVALPTPEGFARVRPMSIKIGETTLNVKDSILVTPNDKTKGGVVSVILTFTNDSVVYEISDANAEKGLYLLRVYEDLTDDGVVNVTEKSRFLFTVEK